ncbi:unnamed protein product [Ectocarpus sp. 8 AP-2014]
MLTVLNRERASATSGVLVLCTRRHEAAEANPQDFRQSMTDMDLAAKAILVKTAGRWKCGVEIGTERESKLPGGVSFSVVVVVVVVVFTITTVPVFAQHLLISVLVQLTWTPSFRGRKCVRKKKNVAVEILPRFNCRERGGESLVGSCAFFFFERGGWLPILRGRITLIACCSSELVVDCSASKGTVLVFVLCCFSSEV